MTKNSQKTLRGVMKEVLLEVLPPMFQEHGNLFDQKLDDLKVNLRDEIHSTVKASEAGLIRRMDEAEARLNKRMDSGFETILEVIDDGILPDLKTHERNIYTMKRHLKLA